jgi:iron complex outermembrane receptor protein
METNKKWFKRNTLVHAVAFALAATTVTSLHAQEAEETKAEEEDQAERITVVGSRIRQGGFDEARPVDIIMGEAALAQGISDLGGLLRNSTIAAGSSQVTGASSTAFVQNGGTGAQTISLRGLGANRTLVLLNGRRAGPAGTRGGVSSFDFNILPLSMVERVEILKDGASSVYGSDAVAGVINIITKKGDGGNVEAYLSQPEQSGGEEFRVNATYGQTFDKGSFRVTADYRKQSELAKGDRDFYGCGEQYVFDPASGNRSDLIDPRTEKPRCNDLPWGHIWLYDYQGGDNDNVPRGGKAQFDYDGNLGNFLPPFQSGQPGNFNMPADFFMVNYDELSDAVTNADHPFQDEESFSPNVETVSVFAQADYELSDDTTLYAEVLLNRRESDTNGYRQYWSYKYTSDVAVFSGGPGDPLSAGFTGDSTWLSPTAITDHSDSSQTIDYQRFVVGITGDISDDWYYDVSAQKSRSDGEYYNDRIYEDAIRDQNFAIGSCVGQTTSSRGIPCVDVPWFDPGLLNGAVSQDVRAFLFGGETGTTVYDQLTVEGFVSGPVYELPAGEVSVVFGASYQKDEIEDTPGDITLANNAWGSSGAGITAGKDTSKAVYSEIKVPVLYDSAFAASLDLEMSLRYTDVETSGSDTTYKVGVNWAITDEYRIRASRGTSFRAPALFELYLADQTSFGSRFIDVCNNYGDELAQGNISQQVADNCAADGLAPTHTAGAITPTITTGGGLGVLSPETSVSRVVGFVWTPEFADFNVSLDWFDIQIESEVTQLGAGNIVSRCYQSDFFANEPLCNQFDRDPTTNAITDIRDSFINIASQVNRGLDLAISYSTDIGAGTFNFYTQHTYTTVAKQALFADTVVDENGEFGEPKHVGNYNLSYTLDDLSINWNINQVGPVSVRNRYNDENTLPTTTRGREIDLVLEAGNYIYHTVSGIYSFDDLGLEVTAGVANLFDKTPPRVSAFNGSLISRQGNSAFYSQYDSLGRRLFVNASYSF